MGFLVTGIGEADEAPAVQRLPAGPGCPPPPTMTFG
jgi:hypothetical protein